MLAAHLSSPEMKEGTNLGFKAYFFLYRVLPSSPTLHLNAGSEGLAHPSKNEGLEREREHLGGHATPTSKLGQYPKF